MDLWLEERDRPGAGVWTDPAAPRPRDGGRANPAESFPRSPPPTHPGPEGTRRPDGVKTVGIDSKAAE